MVQLKLGKNGNGLAGSIRKAIKRNSVTAIISREGEAVLLPLKKYEGLLETLELLSTRGFAKKFRQARRDIAEGKIYSLDRVFGRR